MNLNIFGKKPPTVPQVAAEQAKLAQRRAEIQARQAAIHEQLVAAYGTAQDTDPLHSEADRLSRELRTLADVSAELETQRHQAARRELLAAERQRIEATLTDITTLRDYPPRIAAARRALAEALEGERQTRMRIWNNQQRQILDLKSQAESLGLSWDDLRTDYETLKTEYPDFFNSWTLPPAAAIDRAIQDLLDQAEQKVNNG